MQNLSGLLLLKDKDQLQLASYQGLAAGLCTMWLGGKKHTKPPNY